MSLLTPVKSHVNSEIQARLRSALPSLRPDVMAVAQGFFPHAEGADSFMLPKTPPAPARSPLSPLPVPPRELMGDYGSSVEDYLESGRRDVQTMRQIVARTGTPLDTATRIMEFGCSSGRMVRWLADLADTREVWGTDIRASRITWCRQFLSPPLHFCTTTIDPHLPFEDRSFDFIFAGSVFTHIDDLAWTWLLELRRVTRPGGRLYITIHDRHTVAVLEDKDKSMSHLSARADYQAFSRSDFGMFTIGRSLDSQVFYDADYFCGSLQPFFRPLSVTEGAYWYQTAVLVERV